MMHPAGFGAENNARSLHWCFDEHRFSLKHFFSFALFYERSVSGLCVILVQLLSCIVTHHNSGIGLRYSWENTNPWPLNPPSLYLPFPVVWFFVLVAVSHPYHWSGSEASAFINTFNLLIGCGPDYWQSDFLLFLCADSKFIECDTSKRSKIAFVSYPCSSLSNHGAVVDTMTSY